jgi:hypothetical protein
VRTADKYVRARIETTLAKAGVESFTGGKIQAYVNHGRWVADCPCNGAELVDPDHKMLCGSCGAEHDVQFPGPKTRARIEELLDLREPMFRNWTFEPVSELEAENIEHGIWEKK